MKLIYIKMQIIVTAIQWLSIVGLQHLLQQTEILTGKDTTKSLLTTIM